MRRPTREAGFTLTELIVVAGIIAIMAAVAIPNIGRFIRNFRIRGAADEVAGNIQRARSMAVKKNANQGVAFVIQNANTYWVHVEDDQTPQTPPTGRQPLVMATPDRSQSTRYQLPQGVTFAQCPAAVAPATPAAPGIRFSRLGAACALGTSTCAAVPVTGATMNAVFGDARMSVCLFQPRTGLTRWIQVSLGGRVESMRR